MLCASTKSNSRSVIPAVKICGITRVEDALAASESGASFLGLIFVPSSARLISSEQAAVIAAEVRRRRESVRVVGVFMDQTLEEIRAVLDVVILDLVQLHGDEPDSLIRELQVPVIKAFGVDRTMPETNFHPSAQWLMFDTQRGAKRGGTGETFDWNVINRERIAKRFLLAGGLDATNIAAAIEAVRPDAVDISSGVEDSPGIKNHQKIRDLIRTVHRVHSGSGEETETRG